MICVVYGYRTLTGVALCTRCCPNNIPHCTRILSQFICDECLEPA